MAASTEQAHGRFLRHGPHRLQLGWVPSETASARSSRSSGSLCFVSPELREHLEVVAPGWSVMFHSFWATIARAVEEESLAMAPTELPGVEPALGYHVQGALREGVELHLHVQVAPQSVDALRRELERLGESLVLVPAPAQHSSPQHVVDIRPPRLPDARKVHPPRPGCSRRY